MWGTGDARGNIVGPGTYVPLPVERARPSASILPRREPKLLATQPGPAKYLQKRWPRKKSRAARDHAAAFKRRRDTTAHIVAKKRNSGKGWTSGFGAQFNDKTLLRRAQVDGAQKGTSSLSIHDLQEVHGRRAERFALRLALPDVRVKGSPYQHRMWSVADPAARLTQEEMGWLYEHQIFGYHDRVALKPLWDLPDASLRFKADLIEPTAGPTRIKSAKDIAIVKGAQRIIIPYDRPSRSRKSTRLFSRGSEKSVGSSRASTPLPWPLPMYTARQSVSRSGSRSGSRSRIADPPHELRVARGLVRRRHFLSAG